MEAPESLTTAVRFEFHVRLRPDPLIFAHAIPQSLLSATPDITLLSSTLEPIFSTHYSACQALSSRTCQRCAQASTKVLLTPMSWLHRAADPCVNVWVSAVCARGECEGAVRGEMEGVMRVLAEEVQGCWGRCGREGEEVRKCTGCGVVKYCGRECQRRDWKVHKRVCRALGG